MHFRFHWDGHNGHRNFGARGARWAAFARAFSGEFGNNWGEERGPRRRRFGSEALRYLVLHLLSEEPRHGYDVIKAIETLSAGLYSPSPGMIYPLLTLLADQGLIEELPGEEGRRRYAITAAGTAALDEAKAQVKDVLERLAELAGAARDDDSQPLRRAFRNLKSATGERMAAEDSGRETALKIAEILDEAAQKIERL
jgi:DNA-binding PadR family transcriptional regulator